MGNMPGSSHWKQILIGVFAVALSAALLFMMLANSGNRTAVAQTADTPTPEPTATATAEPTASATSLPTATATPEGTDDGGEQIGKSGGPKYGNMDSILNQLVGQVENGEATAKAAASTAPINDDESVAVTVQVEDEHLEATTEYLNENGASVRFAELGTIEAYVPVTLLGDLSERDGVTKVSTIIPPQAAQDTLTSPAIRIHGADAWHLAGFRGEGMKIGIIDVGFVGFRDLLGLELPESGSVYALCFTDLGTITTDVADCEIDSRHGTGVTEAAFDIAPEATYYISNPGSWGDLLLATRWLAFHGVDTINYSVGWTWSGPGDGTSPYRTSPLRTVDFAVANNITWVNSAGNDATSTYTGAFSDPNENGIHNFTETDECNEVQLGADERFLGQMRWDDEWGDPTTDLDLWLVNKESGERVAVSDSFQPEFDEPFEGFIFVAEEKGIYCVEVRLYDGIAPDWIQVSAFYGQDLEHATAAGSITTPAESANPGLLAVGASFFLDPTELEEFSSQGPVTPDVDTIKPDVVAVDGVFSVSYGRNFFGTSQSSPHVAGMVALAKQLNPDSNAVEVANYMRSNAFDLGDEGPDYAWGYGIAILPASAVPFEHCIEDLGTIEDSGEIEEEGTWTESCVSDRPAFRGSGERYARYYTFELTDSGNVSISLTSDEDTQVYLTEGVGRSGELVGENDDADPGSDTDSLLELEDLPAGEYTIEATTFESGTTGNFTLTVTVEIVSRQTAPRVGGFIEISYGSDHACGLNVDGTITCWGSNEHGKATPPAGRFRTVSSGDHSSCAIRREGSEVVCWGIFSVGQ